MRLYTLHKKVVKVYAVYNFRFYGKKLHLHILQKICVYIYAAEIFAPIENIICLYTLQKTVEAYIRCRKKHKINTINNCNLKSAHIWSPTKIVYTLREKNKLAKYPKSTSYTADKTQELKKKKFFLFKFSTINNSHFSENPLKNVCFYQKLWFETQMKKKKITNFSQPITHRSTF